MPRKRRTYPIVRCRIPESLDLESLEKSSPVGFGVFRADVVAALSEYYLRRAANDGNVDRFGYVKLRQDHLRAIHSGYKKYIRLSGWAEDRSYQPGKRSKGYRWDLPEHPRFRSIELTDPTVINGMERLRVLREQEYVEWRSLGVRTAVEEEVTYFAHIVDPVGFRREPHRRMVLDWSLTQDSVHRLQASFRRFSSSRGISVRDRGSSSSEPPYVADRVPDLLTKEDVQSTFDWWFWSLKAVTVKNGWEAEVTRWQTTGTLEPTKCESIRSGLIELQEGIQTGNFNFRWVRGRLYTTITQMPRSGRSLINLDGHPDLVSVDLRTAQPSLMVTLARDLEVDESHIRQFQRAIDRDLYRELGRELYGHEINDDERDVMKTEVLRALFSRNQQKLPAKDALSRIAPDLFAMVAGMKKVEPYNEFAVNMQRLESDFIVKLVGNELRKAAIPALSVHDCVIVKDHHAAKTEGIIKRIGRDYYGITVGLKAEPLRFAAQEAVINSPIDLETEL